MVLDMSAVVAIFGDEAEAETFERQIANDPVRLTYGFGSSSRARA